MGELTSIFYRFSFLSDLNHRNSQIVNKNDLLSSARLLKFNNKFFEVIMIVGNYNYHQILFAIDSFNNLDDKMGYLDKIETELKRIINCFDAPKTLTLKMNASKNITTENNCDELKDFIRKQFEMVTTNPYDTRYPGEGTLRGLVRSELINYTKLLAIIEDEKSNIIKNHSIKKEENEFRIISKSSYILLEKNTPHNIAKTIRENYGKKIVWINSIGELIDIIKIIIVLELIPGLNEKRLINFISKNFVNINKGPFKTTQIEKVYGMLQNTFWQNERSEKPKYFQ